MKRSAANTETPPERFVLLLDENLAGKTILATLSAASIPVKGQQDLMERGISDSELLQQLSKLPHHFLVTRDPDFRYKPDVVATLRHVQAAVFVMTSSGNKTGEQLAEIIIRAWPAMKRFIARHPVPFIAKVMTDGHVHEHH